MVSKIGRVGIVDITDKELNSKFNSSKKILDKLEGPIKKIEAELNKAPAQERLIVFDVLTGVLCDTCKLSSFIISAVLQKYLGAALIERGPTPKELEIANLLGEIKSKKETKYIG